jgi:hypothetical protein
MCYIEQDVNNKNKKKLYVKLYNVLHFLASNKTNDIEEIYKNNSDVILENSQSLISKIIIPFIGGANKNDIINIDYNNYDDKNYKHLELYLEHISTKTRDYFMRFMNDIYSSIELFATKDKIHLEKVNEILKILSVLEVIEKQYNLGDFILLQYKENSLMYNNFHLKMKYLYNFVSNYESFVHKKVPNNYILISWFLSRLIIFDSITPDELSYVNKYFLPNIFEKYNVYEHLIRSNIFTVINRFTHYMDKYVEFNEINICDKDDYDELYTFNINDHLKYVFDCKYNSK